MAGTVVASVVKNDTTSPPAFQNSAGTEIGTLCRAWVNFNGTTAGIRASFNVSSVTRNGTGDYTVTFTNAMPDTNYAAVSSGQLDNSGSANGDVITGGYRSATSHSTTSYRTSTVNSGGVVTDPVVYELAVFR